MDFVKHPSPNYSKGRNNYTPEAIVVHCTDGTFPGDLDWLTNEISSVSSHFLISPVGVVYELVDVQHTAWHAGLVVHPSWKGIKKTFFGSYVNPNYYTIGIEVSMKGTSAIADVQKESLVHLISYLANTYTIPKDREHIIGHREIRSNKTCPGSISLDDIVSSLTGEKTKEQIKKEITNLLYLL